jgi:hypothetical protein
MVLRVIESPESLDALVARAEAAAQQAAAVWLDAVTTHIHELAAATEAMLAETRRIAADVPGNPNRHDSLGEGGEQVELVNLAAMDAHRYAQEAGYWLAAYQAVQARRASGRPALSWDYDAELEPLRSQVAYTREAMREATGTYRPFQQLPANRMDTRAAKGGETPQHPITQAAS